MSNGGSGSRGRGRGGARKQPVSFAGPPDPPFLQRMKAQLGYKEGPTIDTKREELERSNEEDGVDRDDEKPTVVVLRSGDLTEAEAKGIDQDILNEEAKDGKIKFKRPTKRPAEMDEAAEKIKIKLDKKESNMAQVKNKSLLSFDDEENDDGS